MLSEITNILKLSTKDALLILVSFLTALMCYDSYTELMKSNNIPFNVPKSAFVLICVSIAKITLTLSEALYAKSVAAYKINQSINSTYKHLKKSQINIIEKLMKGQCVYNNKNSDVLSLLDNGYIIRDERISDQENTYKIRYTAKRIVKRNKKHELNYNIKSVTKKPTQTQSDFLRLYFSELEYCNKLNSPPNCYYDAANHLSELNLLEKEIQSSNNSIKFSINKSFAMSLSKRLYRKKLQREYIIIDLKFVPGSGASGGGAPGSIRNSPSIYT